MRWGSSAGVALLLRRDLKIDCCKIQVLESMKKDAVMALRAVPFGVLQLTVKVWIDECDHKTAGRQRTNQFVDV